MRSTSYFVVICFLAIFFSLNLSVGAQDEARPAWIVTSYDITIPSVGTERALNARAILSARNIGRGAGSTLTVRLNSAAEIKSITIGSTTATFSSRPDVRSGTQ